MTPSQPSQSEGIAREDVRDVLVTRYEVVEALRRGSGGSEEDPYTGGAWYRAQLVALRDVAHALGLRDELPDAH